MEFRLTGNLEVDHHDIDFLWEIFHSLDFFRDGSSDLFIMFIEVTPTRLFLQLCENSIMIFDSFFYGATSLAIFTAL